ncbi:MAG TPA: DUF2795 domain-containing protein [Ktedonobacteraceae bacterium]|nr:DUF2795 domain-containing protein [Ktedonobacteraceae bacterium]
MNIDPGQLNQLMSKIPFPIGKQQLVDLAKQHGANDQITGMLNKLPDKTYNSPQDLQKELGGLGGLGNIRI